MRALLDRLHGHGDVALARDHEDRRAVSHTQSVQDVEAGTPRHMHVEHTHPGVRLRSRRKDRP